MSMEGGSHRVTPSSPVPIAVPVFVTNRVTNPSFETGTTDWSGAACTLATVTSVHTSGTHSIEITADGSLNDFEATYASAYDIADLTPHHVAVDILGITDSGGVGGVQVVVNLYDLGLLDIPRTVNSPLVTAADLPYHFQAPLLRAGEGLGPYGIEITVVTAGISAVGDKVVFDSVIWTETELPIPYFDGDTADDASYTYDWTGTPHASTSTRTRL